MNACIGNDKGYIVYAWHWDYGHFMPVVKFESQSDAIEFRDLIQRDGINERRLKLFIKNYDGRPHKILLGRHDFRGEPVLRRI